eukprot:TRINITY_DN25300_c0_g1_i2.p1 TRINITY_DN25300_c0_g1~~TRINITY_DN25300_c0_g1_i2.p1  ORF type:complete len:419 (-),score=137.14 TRINITY_DN25300_c0_g1_i2:28-1284(-)
MCIRDRYQRRVRGPNSKRMPYSFSIAPTNKAKCKGKCKEFIDKGAIRFATEGEGWGDFSVSSYRCLDCVTKKQFENVLANHGPIETVPGFDALDDDDQESVMEAAAEVGVAPAKKAPAKKAPTKKKKAAPQKKKDHPDVKADKLRKRLRELVLMRRFQYIDIEIDGGAQVFPLKQQQRDELAKWAAHKKFDTDWLQVEDGPLGFVANSGSTNALVLGDGAWEDDEAQEGAKWAELVSARDFGCVQVQVGNQKFQPRQNQQDELVKWAAGGKFDTGWLVVEDFPSHFVDQNGKMNRLCLTDDAFLARHKGKKTKAAPLASPPAKKAKVTASPQSAGKKIQIPADFWAAQGSKPKPFSPLELKKVEDKLGYQLPRSYLQLMMKQNLSLIHISEPTRLLSISYAVFCLKKKKKHSTYRNLQ